MGKGCFHFFSAVLDRILFIIAGNDNIDESLDVGIKDMDNIYYLGPSGERLLPFGLLVLQKQISQAGRFIFFISIKT